MFDPYIDWLQISEERRPPTLYQLLGVGISETDPKAIEAAVSRQLSRVQSHITGSHSKDAWRIIDEIALAKATLLDPARRAAYDKVYVIGPRTTASTAMTPSTNEWWKEEAPVAIPMPAGQGPSPVSPDWVSHVAPQQSPIPATASPVVNHPTATPRSEPKKAAPTALAKAFSFDSHDPPSAEGFPTPPALTMPKRKQGGPPFAWIGGGIVVLGLIAGGIFFATKNDKKPDDNKSLKIATNDTNPTPTKKNKPKEKEKKNTGPEKTPEKKKPLPKVAPKNDPPPPIEIADEFKSSKLFVGHDGTPRALSISPDGKQLLTGGDDGAVLSWFPNQEKPSRRKTLKSPVVGVGFLPGGKEAVVADGGTIFVLDMATNEVRRELMNPAGGIAALAISSDGKHVVTACTDGRLRWWDINKADLPERTIDVLGDKEKDVRLECVALAADGKTAMVGTPKGEVSVWDMATGRAIKKWKAHAGVVTAVAVAKDGKLAASAGIDKVARIWDPTSGTEIMKLQGHAEIATAIAFSADSSMLFTTGTNMTVRGWDVATGLPLRWSFKSDAKTQSLALDPKDRYMIVGLGDSTFQMLFLPTVRPDSPPRAVRVHAPSVLLPIPVTTVVEPAVMRIREKYKADYGQMAADDRPALVDKLLAQANFAPSDSATRYAYFQEARDLAAKLGRIDDAFKAIEARSRWFDADDLADKVMALKSSAQGAVDSVIARASLGVVEEAERQARFDIVDEMFRQRELFPQPSDVPQQNAKIQEAEKRWRTAAADRELAKKLAADLNGDPASASANGSYGKYLCFHAGNWQEGLSKLAKGDDPALKDLAKKELAAPKDAKSQIELGKGWFEFGAKADNVAKPSIWLHARSWYAKARDGDLPPLEKLSAEQRVNDINKKIAALGKVSLFRLGEPVTRHGFNTMRTQAALESQWAVANSVGLMPTGLALKDDASMTSRFNILDGCRVEFEMEPDGREIKVQLNGEEAAFRPVASSPVFLVVERKGANLKFTLKSPLGDVIEERSATLAPPKQIPTPISLRIAGAAVKDGLHVTSAVVCGPVKPTD